MIIPSDDGRRDGAPRNCVVLPHSNLIWDFDGFVALQLNTLDNYSVAADRVVVAAELDKFSRNMNNSAECHRDRRNSMN